MIGIIYCLNLHRTDKGKQETLLNRSNNRSLSSVKEFCQEKRLASRLFAIYQLPVYQSSILPSKVGAEGLEAPTSWRRVLVLAEYTYIFFSMGRFLRSRMHRE